MVKTPRKVSLSKRNHTRVELNSFLLVDCVHLLLTLLFLAEKNDSSSPAQLCCGLYKAHARRSPSVLSLGLFIVGKEIGYLMEASLKMKSVTKRKKKSHWVRSEPELILMMAAMDSGVVHDCSPTVSWLCRFSTNLGGNYVFVVLCINSQVVCKWRASVSELVLSANIWTLWWSHGTQLGGLTGYW